MPSPPRFLRFPPPPALRTRMLKLLEKIDADPDPARHTDELCTLVIGLTESGMDYYFLKAAVDAKLGFVARQTATFGVAGAVRVMAPIVRTVLGGADAAQLKAVSKHIRGLMA